jgi:hypothetical protein
MSIMRMNRSRLTFAEFHDQLRIQPILRPIQSWSLTEKLDVELRSDE